MGNNLKADVRGCPAALVLVILILLISDRGTKAFAQVVTNAADSGSGTLRYFITNAAPGSTITFSPNLSGATITLGSTLQINTSLTIDASALPGGIQINGNGSNQVFNITSNITVVLNSLTITNGFNESIDYAEGGGIYNLGTLALNECSLLKNRAGEGGGIFNASTLTMNRCTLAVNYAVGYPDYGGGICNGGTATLNECTLTGNFTTSGGEAGGIYNEEGTVTLNACTLSENEQSAGDGIITFSDLNITNCIIFDSSGVDIYNDTVRSGGILTYGGSNIIRSVTNFYGTITGPAPISAAPDLAPLGNYGGPTQTMPPLLGSPAIGAGSVAANTFTTDQRGYSRTQNGLIDIGAVELSTIQFTATPTNEWLPNPVQFNCPAVDSDGSAITKWNWSFGDGNISTIQNPLHTYTYMGTGSYLPSLIVTNSLGLALAASGPVISTFPTLRFQSFTRINGGYQFTWNTVSNNPAAVYQLQYTTNLATPVWTNLGGVLSGIDPVITTADTSPTNRQRFYRLTAAMGKNIFQDTFDPPNGAGIGISYDGGDVANPFVGVVSGAGTSGSAALQIECSANNGPNGYTYLAGQWQDLYVSGNSDTNLSDYYLSFDAYVTGDASHHSGGGLSLEIQEGAGTNFSTSFPQGQLQTYQPYQGGSDLLVPQSGVWKHFTINLGSSQFQIPNGTNITFNVTGASWQLIFQLNSLDWGGEPQTNSTLIIDNIALTVLPTP